MRNNLQITKHVPPLGLRKLRAEMAMKHVTLRELAKSANVPYVTASAILTGAINNTKYLSALTRAIARAPMPAEVAR